MLRKKELRSLLRSTEADALYVFPSHETTCCSLRHPTPWLLLLPHSLCIHGPDSLHRMLKNLLHALAVRSDSCLNAKNIRISTAKFTKIQHCTNPEPYEYIPQPSILLSILILSLYLCLIIHFLEEPKCMVPFSSSLCSFSFSSVGIATGYGLDDWGVGVRVPVGSRTFSKSSRPALGSTQPPVQWVWEGL
jgi:hypothetical protein